MLHLGLQEDTITTRICAMLVSIVEDSAWDTGNQICYLAGRETWKGRNVANQCAAFGLQCRRDMTSL